MPEKRRLFLAWRDGYGSPHGRLRLRSDIVLHEAEAAGRLLILVQAHHNHTNIAAAGEELVDLLLGGVEAQVSHVKCTRVAERSLLLGARALQLVY